MDSMFRKDEFYLIVNSSHRSADIYAQDKHYAFHAYLPNAVNLSNWKVGLVDMVWTNEFRAASTTSLLRMVIETNFVQPSIVNGLKRQVIGTVPVTTTVKRRVHYEPAHVKYMKITGSEWQEFEFYIRDESGQFLRMLKSPVSLTLHFKQ